MAPSCSSRRDTSNGVLVDFEKSIWNLTSGQGHVLTQGSRWGVMIHAIRSALTRRTLRCQLFPSSLILSWDIDKWSFGPYLYKVTSMWRHIWSDDVICVCNVTCDLDLASPLTLVPTVSQSKPKRRFSITLHSAGVTCQLQWLSLWRL